MALAGPPKEKPHLPSSYNAGTAEPMGVSPPEAVAYQVLVRIRNFGAIPSSNVKIDSILTMKEELS
jgi:hypothetical protein